MGFARIALHVKRIDWFSNRFDHFLCWLSEKLVFAQSIGFPIDLTTFYNHWHPPMLSDSLGFVKRLSDLQGCHAHRCFAQIDWFSKRFGQTPQFPKVLKFDWVCKAIERFPLVPRMHPESPFSLGFVKRLSDFRVFTQFRLIDWIYN